MTNEMYIEYTLSFKRPVTEGDLQEFNCTLDELAAEERDTFDNDEGMLWDIDDIKQQDPEAKFSAVPVVKAENADPLGD